MDFNFSAFDSPSIKMRVSIGAYYFDGKPVYIVEHIEEDLSEYVIVYNVHDVNNIDNPVKKYRIEEYRKTIPGGTTISNIIKSRLPKKVTPKKVEEEPIFIATVIPLGRDTVTGETGKGFFERQPDNKKMTQKDGIVVEHGKYTGVFIGLSNIKWFSSYTPLESVVEYYKKTKEDRLNVF